MIIKKYDVQTLKPLLPENVVIYTIFFQGSKQDSGLSKKNQFGSVSTNISF